VFRAMFYFITESLGVSISWYWQYLLLVVIVFMAYTAYSAYSVLLSGASRINMENSKMMDRFLYTVYIEIGGNIDRENKRGICFMQILTTLLSRNRVKLD